MSFKQVRGQEQAIRIIQKDLIRKNIFGTYLFTGPPGVGKKLVALNFAKAINCRKKSIDSCDHCSSCQKIDKLNHPDVQVTKAEDGSIKIEQTREIKREMGYKVYEGKKKIWILEDAEKLTIEAANSLLKFLEEPPSNVVIVLISSSPEKLPFTIVSRCKIVRFSLLSLQQIKEFLEEKTTHSPELISLVSRLAKGRIGEASYLINNEDILREREKILNKLFKETFDSEIFEIAKRWSKLEKDKLNRFLDMILFWFRDILILKLGIKEFIINKDKEKELKRIKNRYSFLKVYSCIETVEQTQRYLKANVSPLLSLEGMWLKLAC